MALAPRGEQWNSLLEEAAARLHRELPQTVTVEIPWGVLGALLDQVVTWNRRVDLTAARSAEELVDLYLADAVVLAASGPAGERWVDVGSGGGAPGLVLGLLAPSVALTLVEPRAKRVAFLRNTLAVLGVTHVEIVRGRSEELGPGGFETAISRATLPPPAWVVEGARLARRAVWVLLAQGEPPALPGWRLDRDERYRWPLTGVERRAARYVPHGAP